MNTTIQPPGLMKMSLNPSNHHYEHQVLPPRRSEQSMTKCATPTILGCHMNSCMVAIAGRHLDGYSRDLRLWVRMTWQQCTSCMCACLGNLERVSWHAGRDTPQNP